MPIRTVLALSLAALALLPPTSAPAQRPACPKGRCPVTYRTTAPTAPTLPASYVHPVYRTTVAPPAGADPYGFTAWLNGVRAQHGLAPVGYDANLANWAASNNAQQHARGLGHHVMGPARRQNSAMGGGHPGSMWLNSPAHRANMLAPEIRFIGIAASGSYWTLNAY